MPEASVRASVPTVAVDLTAVVVVLVTMPCARMVPVQANEGFATGCCSFRAAMQAAFEDKDSRNGA